MERLSDHYTTANLSPEILAKIKSLEEELRAITAKDVILIAYEESVHNPT